MTNFYGAILAAGRGSRLRPITDDIPKPLVTWLHAPMMEHAFEAMKAAGAEDIGFNASHCAEKVHAWATAHSISAGKVVTEPSLRGTGGGVRGIARALGILNDDRQNLVVWNGDIIAAPDVIRLTEKLERTGAIACLLLREKDPSEAGIGVSTGNGARVVSLPGHGGVVHRLPSAEGAHARELGYCGIMAVRPTVLRQLPADAESCVFRDLLGPLLARGERVVYVEYDGFFSDLGTPNRFYQASLDALKTDFGGLVEDGVFSVTSRGNGRLWMHESAEVDPSVSIDGEVVCGPAARVLEGARLTRCQVTESVVEGAVTDQLWIGGKSAPLLLDT